MYAQIPQVGLGDHHAHGIGHAADAKLEAGAVGNGGHDQLRHGLVHLRGRAAGAQLGHRGIVPLYDLVHVHDVDLAARQAVHPGHVLVDLHDDMLGNGQHVGQMGGGQAVIKVAVLVHGATSTVTFSR